MDSLTELFKLLTAIVLLISAALKLMSQSKADGSDHEDENGRASR